MLHIEDQHVLVVQSCAA